MYNTIRSAQQVLNLAGITISQLAVAAHRQNFLHIIIVRNNQGGIIDALTAETTDGCYRNNDPLIDSVYKVGTGSIPCNCDACIAGDDPAWAGATEYCDSIEDELNQGIDDVVNR